MIFITRAYAEQISDIVPKGSVNCCITSPPFWQLRDYGFNGQIGLERKVGEYVDALVEVFRQVDTVTRDDATIWIEIGDTYKNKQLAGVPWRLAFALVDSLGWLLRDEIIWHKPSPMPTSQKDRTTCAHSRIFMFAKQKSYFYDIEAIKEPVSKKTGSSRGSGSHKKAKEVADPFVSNNDQHARAIAGAVDRRVKRSVWKVPNRGTKIGHFASYPERLVEPMVLAGCPETVCEECFAPYYREVERVRVPTRPGIDTKVAGKAAAEIGNRDPLRHVTTTKTIGWSPSCECGRGTVAGMILDPFAGTGTTGAVAKSLGRSAWLIDASDEYVQVMQARLL